MTTSPILPTLAAFEDALFHFTDQFVTVELMTADADDLTPAAEYILRSASIPRPSTSSEVDAWTFPASKWPEVVRLLDLIATDPNQALFDAWVTFDDSWEYPEPLSRQWAPASASIPPRDEERIRDVTFLRLLSRTDPPHPFPAPAHGIEGSEFQ